MKVLCSWLREFLPATIAPADLARDLLLMGFEVSDMRRTGPGFTGIVIGEILDIQKHPNADRLSLCRVSDGKGTLSIVCGAKNIAVGQRVPVARIGATLPGGRSIERAKIRGAESQGMICSAAELGLADGGGEGIHVLAPGTPVGRDAADLLGGDDTILEVEITPNRPDCLSHFGLARELAIHYELQVKPPEVPETAAGAEDPRLVEIEAKGACQRYIARLFVNVRVGPSLGWLSRRLEAVGLRPINAAVDVTNYVLFELGHPLHVFDHSKLDGGRVVVRFAKDGERLKALDGKDYALTPSELVIADASRPVAIAGVMGGEASGVTDKTQAILLESARFEPGVVRRASQRLRLRSDSSYRFERGTDCDTAALASARAAVLLSKVCGWPAQTAISDAYTGRATAAPIEVSSDRVNQILGSNYPAGKVELVLKALSARTETVTQGLRVFPPPHRLDLRTVWDLAEEVARHLGYDGIGSEPAPVKLSRPKSLPAVDLLAALRARLAALGFYEAYNYDFLSPKELESCGLAPSAAPAVLNPISEDWAHLRPSLLPGLLKSAAFNFNRGAKGLRLYEIGKIYSPSETEVHENSILSGLLAGTFPARPDWRAKSADADKSGHFFAAKGAVAALLAAHEGASFEVSTDRDPLLHPQASLGVRVGPLPVGRAGLLHPTACSAWDLPPGSAAFWLDLDALGGLPAPSAKLKPFSTHPSVMRDLSVLIAKTVPYAEVEACLAPTAFLARLDLVDVFEGKGVAAGKKSLTLRLTLSAADRTLRDEDVQAAVADALDRLHKACKATLRA